jgi:hypothetical protein
MTVRCVRVCGCKKNTSFYCSDKRVPRSLFGLGARLCSPDGCPYYEGSPRPKSSPGGTKK